MPFRPVFAQPLPTDLWFIGVNEDMNPLGTKTFSKTFDLTEPDSVAIFDVECEYGFLQPNSVVPNAAEFQATVDAHLTDGMTTWQPYNGGFGTAALTLEHYEEVFNGPGIPPFRNYKAIARKCFRFFPGRGSAGDPPNDSLEFVIDLADINVSAAAPSPSTQIPLITVELRRVPIGAVLIGES